jgi:hypothetical protein
MTKLLINKGERCSFHSTPLCSGDWISVDVKDVKQLHTELSLENLRVNMSYWKGTISDKYNAKYLMDWAVSKHGLATNSYEKSVEFVVSYQQGNIHHRWPVKSSSYLKEISYWIWKTEALKHCDDSSVWTFHDNLIYKIYHYETSELEVKVSRNRWSNFVSQMTRHVRDIYCTMTDFRQHIHS